MSARQRGASLRWGQRTETTEPDTANGRALAASSLGLLGCLGLTALALMCWHAIQTARPVGALGSNLEVSLALHLVVLGAAGLVSLWLALVLLIGAAAALPGRLLAPLRYGARFLAPRLAPRLAAALVTATVSLVPLGAAQAQVPVAAARTLVALPTAVGAETPLTWLAPGLALAPEPMVPGTGPAARGSGSEAPEPGSRAPEPGWAPTTPPTRQDPASIGLVSRGGAGPDAIVVRAGDTLWDVAARHLGPDADASEIAAAWPRWHEANRAVIGSDPDLILPGTELVPPASTDRMEGRR